MIDESPIPFEAFMQRALHDPEKGYYARRIAGVGRRGDFTTAPMISATLSQAIAAWAAAAMKETGCRDLIEIGPGEGVLAAGVLENLPWHRRWRTRLHLVETSVPLAGIQRKRLGKRVIWHANMAEAVATCGGNAVIFSNELVDAFAVRRFQKTILGWQEIAVSKNTDGDIHESLLPVSPLPDSSSFTQPHPTGQRIEVHDSYRSHLIRWLPSWKSGRMLTIDYGSTADRLYPRKPGGSVRGYLHQQRLEGLEIYRNPGRQDLTADVNFSDLQRWSQPWAETISLAGFRNFLLQWAVPSADQDPQLTDPLGAGGAFQVLAQQPLGSSREKAVDSEESTA